MANTKVDHLTYKPLVNYSYSYAGGMTLLENRIHPGTPRTRYQNSSVSLVNLNPITIPGLGVSETNVSKRYYFQDAAYFSRGRTDRAGSYLTLKIYLKVDAATNNSYSAFQPNDVINFTVKSYNQAYINNTAGATFFLEYEALDYTNALFLRTLYNKQHTFSKTYSMIKDLEYFEIDLHNFKYNVVDGDFPYGYDVVNNIYELSIPSFTRNGVLIYLDRPGDNENVTFVNFTDRTYKTKLSESSPQFDHGHTHTVGTQVGGLGDFSFTFYDRNSNYGGNNFTGYAVYNDCTQMEQLRLIDLGPSASENAGTNLDLMWTKSTSVNISTGLLNYNDNLKNYPTSEAIQVDGSGNVKRIFWKFGLPTYYGRILSAYLIFYVSSAEKSSDKMSILPYVIRASSLPDSKYQNWTSAGVDTATLNEMYDESTVVYSGNEIFGGNGDIDGSLTYGKSPFCIYGDSEYYWADVTGHPFRGLDSNGTITDWENVDLRRRFQGISALEQYKKRNSSINYITFILEDINQPFTHSYNKSTQVENINFGINRNSTYPSKKTIKGALSSTSYLPFLIFQSQYPKMVIYDSNNNVVENEISTTIYTGQTPTTKTFKIKNSGRGILNPAISKENDASSTINSIGKTHNKDIVTSTWPLSIVENPTTAITEETLTVTFAQINNPGVYYPRVKVYEANTVTGEQAKYINFKITANTNAELQVSTEQFPTVNHFLSMECEYGQDKLGEYKIYVKNTGNVDGILYVVNKCYLGSLYFVNAYPTSKYRYSDLDVDYINVMADNTTQRFGAILPQATNECIVNLTTSCTITDDLTDNLITNGDITTDNWTKSGQVTANSESGLGYTDLTKTYYYRVGGTGGGYILSPNFNLNAQTKYRFDFFLSKTSALSTNDINILLLDSNNNIINTFDKSVISNSLGYKMYRFDFFSTQVYNNCKLKFECVYNGSRYLNVESACVKECKPLSPGKYTGVLEFWDYALGNYNNMISVNYELNVKPKSGSQESAGVIIL